MAKRVGAGLVLGVTAALLVGLLSLSLTNDLPEPLAAQLRSMGNTLAALVGIATTSAFLVATSGRRNLGLALFGVAAALSIGFTTWLSTMIPAETRPVLSASDHVELREYTDGEERGIEHATLGFRLPHPTLALSPSQAIEDETRALAGPGWADRHELWAFETADHGVSVMIDLSRLERADDAARSTLANAVGASLGGDALFGEPEGSDGCSRQAFQSSLANGGRVDGNVLVFEAVDGRAFGLVVTVVSDGQGDWASWLERVSLACEREEANATERTDSR